MQLLDDRASRMSPNQALLTLHAGYIGGHNANYRKWYFAAQLDLDDAIGQTQNPGLNRLKSRCSAKRPSHEKSLSTALDRWREAMHNMSQYDRLPLLLHADVEQEQRERESMNVVRDRRYLRTLESTNVKLSAEVTVLRESADEYRGLEGGEAGVGDEGQGLGGVEGKGR